MHNTERQVAAAEALAAFESASAERRRTRIWAYPIGEDPVDVTEHVVSLLDLTTSSMEWGSGLFNDEDLSAFFELCKLLKFDVAP
jgi:hypothetical protein